MNTVTEDEIKSVLTGMLGSARSENIELFEKLTKDTTYLNAIDLNCPDDFYMGVLYPHQKFVRGLIDKKIVAGRNEKVYFLMLQSQFIEHHFQTWIKKVEGFGCCADKSRTILRRLLRFFVLGEEIKWDYEGEYTFHLPKKIFTTHVEIISFYEALESLYYGTPEKYFAMITQLKTYKP